MARRTSQTITDHVTCDICGKEWDEDVTRRKIDDDKDDMCPECHSANIVNTSGCDLCTDCGYSACPVG